MKNKLEGLTRNRLKRNSFVHENKRLLQQHREVVSISTDPLPVHNVIESISVTSQALATAFVWAQDLRRNAVIKRKGKVEKLHKYDIAMDFLVENGLSHQEFHFCQSFS